MSEQMSMFGGGGGRRRKRGSSGGNGAPPPSEVQAPLHEEARRRYGDIATRISIAVPEDGDPERWGSLFERLREPVAA